MMNALNWNFGVPTASSLHFNGSNIAFVDGHVKWMMPNTLNSDPNNGTTNYYLWLRLKPY